MATGRHIGFRKNGVTRERIDRFSQNLTHTSRRQLLYWGLPKYSHSGESKMAADRHIGFRKNAVTRERIDQFNEIRHTQAEGNSCTGFTSNLHSGESKMAADRHLICKNAVLPQQIDRFSQNLTCTRRKFFLFFVSPEKSLCLKFKMAADRHSGFLKIAVIRERIEQFSQNLTHTSRKLLLFWGHLNICVVENPRWRPTTMLDFHQRR
jgi:hypothetical protein